LHAVVGPRLKIIAWMWVPGAYIDGPASRPRLGRLQVPIGQNFEEQVSIDMSFCWPMHCTRAKGKTSSLEVTPTTLAHTKISTTNERTSK